MEGKLIKMVEGYTLSLTGSVDDLYGISNNQLAEEHNLHKLSLKNCEAIVNGYDLDELAKVNYDCDPYIAEYLEHEFKKGFQKALEILKHNLIEEFEWNVEFDTITYGIGNDENGRPVFETRNILDADGCLILRRK